MAAINAGISLKSTSKNAGNGGIGKLKALIKRNTAQHANRNKRLKFNIFLHRKLSPLC